MGKTQRINILEIVSLLLVEISHLLTMMNIISANETKNITSVVRLTTSNLGLGIDDIDWNQAFPTPGAVDQNEEELYGYDQRDRAPTELVDEDTPLPEPSDKKIKKVTICYDQANNSITESDYSSNKES